MPHDLPVQHDNSGPCIQTRVIYRKIVPAREMIKSVLLATPVSQTSHPQLHNVSQLRRLNSFFYRFRWRWRWRHWHCFLVRTHGTRHLRAPYVLYFIHYF